MWLGLELANKTDLLHKGERLYASQIFRPLFDSYSNRNYIPADCHSIRKFLQQLNACYTAKQQASLNYARRLLEATRQTIAAYVHKGTTRKTLKRDGHEKP